MSLLPPNATPLERALERGLMNDPVGAGAESIDDPYAAPAEILPWLAWGWSVDSWDPDWPEAVKRETIADSIHQHRRKGTRASVEVVLARFDQLAELVEWHQTNPRGQPHSFDIVLPMTIGGAAPGGERATARFADRIIAEIARVKPLREHMRLVQRICSAAAVGIQGVVRPFAYHRREADLLIDRSPDWAAFLQTEAGEPIEASDGSFLDTRP